MKLIYIVGPRKIRAMNNMKFPTDERDRYCDYENQDDECLKQLKNQDKYKYVNTQRHPLYFEKVPDSKLRLTLNSELDQRPIPENESNELALKPYKNTCRM